MEQLPPILGEDPTFLAVVEHVSRLARLDRPCLVVGERGTGKELLTSRLHYLSARWGGPLVKVNCAALSETLLESELFGHEAGAFTGAERRHAGRFERADAGTLVLDEIAIASAAVQETVLRIIEYGEFERVGGRETMQVNVRVVGSTNVDLPALAARGEFRADLLDRLAFDVVTVPPLRGRPADILPLAREFAVEMTRNLGRRVFGGFSSTGEAALRTHVWPGNVRELKNVVERAVWQSADDGEPVDWLQIDPFDSPWRPQPPSVADATAEKPGPVGAGHAGQDYASQVASFEQRLLSEALTRAGGNQTLAARDLDLSYHQFRRLLAKHGLSGSARPGSSFDP